MAMFDDENELNEVDIEKLLGLELEKIIHIETKS